MKEAVRGAKVLIERQVMYGKAYMFGFPFSEYQRVYTVTNENIKGYMSKFDFKGKSSALSVMGSGDHAFNAIYYGISRVDTFDTNKLTEYFVLGIKRSAILRFNYQEYLEFINKILDDHITIEELTELIMSLFPYMENHHHMFWKSILEYNYQLQKNHPKPINLMKMLLIPTKLDIRLGNSYLQDEESYNQLKTNLTYANISFQACDAINLGTKFKDMYDFLFLSNIPDYYASFYGNFWDYEKLREAVDKQLKLVNAGGILAIAYLFHYAYPKANVRRTQLFINSTVSESDLSHGEELIDFPNISSNPESHNHEHDGLLLERKK